MERHGKGIETLGSVLAVAGWALAALAVVLFLASLPEVGSAAPLVALSLASSLIACLALAGLGHLLRAVAQLGRNVHRLAALLQQRQPPG